MKRLYRAAVVLVACVGLAGCGGRAEQQISGEVTLDNVPVKKGRIRFTAKDGKTSPVEVFIEDGKYKAALPVGEYRVEISAPESVGTVKRRRPGPGAEAEATRETIPARYNTKSEIKADVTADQTEYNFPLLSK